MGSFAALCWKLIQEEWDNIHDNNVISCLLTSGYVVCGFAYSHDHLVRERNYGKGENRFRKRLH